MILLKKEHPMATVLKYARRFCESIWFNLILFAYAALIVLVKGEVWGILSFALIMSLLLVLCEDITVTTLPFLLACTFVLKCYNSFDTFIVFAPLGVIPIAAFLFHFIKYRKAYKIGNSFFGICAVAFAITAGGALFISPEDYFSGTSLFYIAGLGIAMVGTYLLMKSEFVERDTYSLRERLFAIFFIAGLFGVFMIGAHYVENFRSIWEAKTINIQWSNNLSTIMMFFLPIPFYYALSKNRLFIFFGFLFYLAIVMTGSRGGLIMGGIELLLCCIFVMVYDKPLRYVTFALCAVGLIFAAMNLDSLLSVFSFSGDNALISEDEPRFQTIFRAIDDFLANPLFGKGLGYTGNIDLYKPVKGAANWYHMMPFQIIGSLGLVGVAAYGYQFFGRCRLIFKKPTLSSLTLGLSYSGILLMSMVNPGEFCPVPYELLAVLLFIFLELPNENQPTNAFLTIKE